MKFPVLHSAIQSGSLSVSKARKIAPVLTLENQVEWVEKAKTLPTRKLEEEVAGVAPREATPERMKFVTEDRLELRLGISKALQEKLKRVQDLEAQRMGRAVSFEETLDALVDLYLEVERSGETSRAGFETEKRFRTCHGTGESTGKVGESGANSSDDSASSAAP